MEENSKQGMNQRLLIAAALSLGVLMLWSYLFPPPKQTQDPNANANIAANTQASPEVKTAQPAPQPIAATPDDTPNKVLSINSPLYKVKLDSKGALATSWILVKNVRDGAPDISLWADGSTEGNNIPLELILQDNPKREYPFRIATGDAAIDATANERNYQLSGAGEITLNSGESKEINFTLSSGDIEITKTFTFHADSYLTDLKISAKKAGQVIPNTKLLIGTAIGDQGIKIHDYYHIESEAVAFVNNDIKRHTAMSHFADAKDTTGTISEAGEIDWAGVGDSYFAMAAIPAGKTSGLEFKGTKFVKEVEPHYSGLWSWITRSQTTKIDRHLITAHLPFIADGSATKIYTGSKDYFTLRDYAVKIDKEVGRETNIGEFINYSWYSPLRWALRPISQFLLVCLNAIYGIVGNYGVAIIIFTIIFYSIFFPMRWYQTKTFKNAQKHQPKMEELKKKLEEYKKKGIPLDDPRMRELQMEQLKMMKGAIPIMGCLPMLLQIPFFVALYTAVTIGIDFRHAAFLWLPDLAASDPYHILEFLFAGSMAGSMIFTPTAPAITDEQKMQQKMMTYMMPAMLLFAMWGSSSGLLLYWFFGNIVSFIQQFIINRFVKAPEPEPIEEKSIGSKKVKPKMA